MTAAPASRNASGSPSSGTNRSSRAPSALMPAMAGPLVLGGDLRRHVALQHRGLRADQVAQHRPGGQRGRHRGGQLISALEAAGSAAIDRARQFGVQLRRASPARPNPAAPAAPPRATRSSAARSTWPGPTRRLSSLSVTSATGISASIAAAASQDRLAARLRCSSLRARWNMVTLTFYRPAVPCVQTVGLIRSADNRPMVFLRSGRRGSSCTRFPIRPASSPSSPAPTAAPARRRPGAWPPPGRT